VGNKFKPFIDFLLCKKPAVVIHIEPIWEMLDNKELIDFLSIQYMKKRKYLNGFLPYMRRLEAKKQIKIMENWRSGLGSYLIDGYSVLIWTPKVL
jgi:hypothetical protein